MGVYVIQREGAEPGDDPEDISVLVEGVEVLRGLEEHCDCMYSVIWTDILFEPKLPTRVQMNF